MEQEHLIIIEEFCASHNIDYSFLNLLFENGLVEVTIIEDRRFIPESQLRKLEQLVRLHYDLNINLEGIDAITNLLDRLLKLKQENGMLRNKLRIYEGGEIDET